MTLAQRLEGLRTCRTFQNAVRARRSGNDAQAGALLAIAAHAFRFQVDFSARRPRKGGVL